MHFTHHVRISKALRESVEHGTITETQFRKTIDALHEQPLDISTSCFLTTLSACHSRILELQKEDAKRHQMDADIGNWHSVVEEELIPLLERIIYWEPSDDEMMSSFGTKWHDGL